MTILDQIESLNVSVRDLNQQLGEAQQKLAAYESRKVPLSESDAARIFHAHPVESDGPSALAVARAALVAAESPASVEAAFKAWSDSVLGGTVIDCVLAAIRAAHDAAIEGGCGAAREDAGPPWLADAAEALGKKDAALNWSQVISEIRELVWQRDGFRKEADRLVDRNNTLCSEAEALEKERDDLRRQLDEIEETVRDLENGIRVEASVAGRIEQLVGNATGRADDLRRQLDALTKPIDGVEELGRIGWEAWHRVHWPQSDPKHRRSEDSANADNASAQAIASRVIGALRSALETTHAGGDFGDAALADFDRAVSSLKIEPAKVGPKSEPFELPSAVDFCNHNEIAIRDRIREIERRLEAGGL